MSASPREERGFANARNAKLHHLANQKRNRTVSAAGRANNHPQRTVLLSAVLAAAPQYFDSFKVACVEKYLTQIDELPEQYQTAEVVYLSQNSLHSLAGIEQFPSLRVLNASDNLIEDIAELQVLTACPALQVASFERNPLAYLPNYRNKVVQLLPRLQMLDGQGISGQDRQRAGAALKQEAACMAVMLSNACMVHKLARTAELLQLHTELRRALFGSSSVLAKSILPSAIPLDLLKFLKLWDYEGGLSPGDRRIINDALTREVVRVHRQLQHAAMQLKGPAQLPALQAWDAAFSQVMLAQQRTIIQLVELVNVLHDEAAKLVAALTRSRTGGSKQGEQEQERQEQAQQQLANEREGLIVDLRDAALELAGVLASKAQMVLDDGTIVSSSSVTATPQHPLLLQQQVNHNFSLPQKVPQQQQQSGGNQQVGQQLQQLAIGQQQQQNTQQQSAQGLAASVGVAPQQLQRLSSSLQQRQQPQQQQQQQARLQMALQEQQLPSFPPSPPQLKQQQLVQQQELQQEWQQRPPGKSSGKPARRSTGTEQLRLRPVKVAVQAAVQGAAATAAVGSRLSPIRTRSSGQDSGGCTDSVRAPALIAGEHSVEMMPADDHAQQQQCSPGVSPSKAAEPRPLSPTAQRLLQCAAMVQHVQQQQQQPMHTDACAHSLYSNTIPAEGLNVEEDSGAAAQTVPGGAMYAADTVLSTAPGSPGLVLPFSSPQRLSADAAGTVQHDTYTVQAAEGGQHQKQWRQAVQSLPSSPVHKQKQQQSHILSRSHSGSMVHFPGDLSQLSKCGLMYERVERFTPVGTLGTSPGSPAAVAAADLAAACAAQANGSSMLPTAENDRGASRSNVLLTSSDQELQNVYWQQMMQQELGTIEQHAAALRQTAWQQQQALAGQQQMHAVSDPNSPNTEDSAYYTINSVAPGSVRASEDAQLLTSVADAPVAAPAAAAALCSPVATSAELSEDADVTAAAMIAAAEATARQLFAVEGVPGSCMFFSPYAMERPAHDTSSAAAAGAAAALTSDAGATAGEGSMGASQAAASDSQNAGFSFTPSHAATSSEGGSYFPASAATQAGTGSGVAVRERSGSSALAVAGEELSFAMTGSAESSPKSCYEAAAGVLEQQAHKLQHSGYTSQQQEQELPQQQCQPSQRPLEQAQPLPQDQNQGQLLWSLLSSTEGSVDVLPSQCSPSGGSLTAAAASTNTSMAPSSTAAVVGAPLSPRKAASPAVLVSGSPRSSITGQAGTPAAGSEMQVQQQSATGVTGTAAAPPAVMQAAVQRAMLAVIPELASPRSSTGIVASPLFPDTASRAGGSLASSVNLSPVRQRLFDSVAVSSSMDVNGGSSMGPSSLAGAIAAQRAGSIHVHQLAGQAVQPAHLQAQQPERLALMLQHTQQEQMPSAALSAIIPASATGSNSPGPYSPGPPAKRLTLEDWNMQVHPQVVAQLQDQLQHNVHLLQQLQQNQQQFYHHQVAVQQVQQQGTGAISRARSVESSLSGISLVANLPSAAPSSRTAAVSDATAVEARSRSMLTSSAPESLDQLQGAATGMHTAALHQAGLDPHTADACVAGAAAASTAAPLCTGSRLTDSAGAAPPGLSGMAAFTALAEPEGALDVRAAAAAAAAAGAISTAAQSTAGSKLTSSSAPTSDGQAALHSALLAALQPMQGTDSTMATNSGPTAGPTSQQTSLHWQPSSPSVQGPWLSVGPVAPSAAVAGLIGPGGSMGRQQDDKVPLPMAMAACPSSPRASVGLQPTRLSVQEASGTVLAGIVHGSPGFSGTNAAHIIEQQLQAQHLSSPMHRSCRVASSSTAVCQATAAVAAAVAAAAGGAAVHRSRCNERPQPAGNDSTSVQPVACTSTAVPIASQLSCRKSDAAEATAAGRPKSPGERKAELLAELQDRLATLAVEKAALEKQLELDRGQMQELQQKADVSAQQAALLQQLQANLLATQQLLQQTGGLAEQHAQHNEQLKQQIQQIQAHMATEAAAKQRRTKADNLARASLCRRMLVHFKDAAHASAAWRGLKADAALHSQQALLRRGLRGWHVAAVRLRQVELLHLRQQRRQMWGVLQAWLLVLLEQRLDAAQATTAVTHWAAHSCRRALSHWRFYAHQTRQLGIELPSSPSSCSACSDGKLQHQQQQSRPLGLLSPRTAEDRRRCRSGSSMHSNAGDLPPGTSRSNSRYMISTAGEGRGWHSRSSAAAAEAEQLKQKLQAAQQLGSLTAELLCSPNSRQPSSSQSPSAAGAAVANPKSAAQGGSLRALSARLSQVLSSRPGRQQSPIYTAISSSSDSEISVGKAVGAQQSTTTTSNAAVAAAWADVADGQRACMQPGRHHGGSNSVAMHSPDLHSSDTTDATNSPDIAAQFSSNALTAGIRTSGVQRGDADATTAAMLHRAERVSTLAGFSSPIRPSRRSATWFDGSAASSPARQQAAGEGRSAASRASSQGRSAAEGGACALDLPSQAAGVVGMRLFVSGLQPSPHLSLSTGNLRSTFRRQQSLSLAAATANSGLVSCEVPVEVQLSFLSAARAQRLWRRRMMLKAWDRWRQLLQVHNEQECNLAAAARRYNRRLQRKAWATWRRYTDHRCYKQVNPDANTDPAKLHIAIQHHHLKEQAVQYRVLHSWWQLMHKAVAARRTAESIAANKQHVVQRHVLQAMRGNVQQSSAKKQLLQKAAGFDIQRQLRSSWVAWSQAVAASRAEAAGKVQQAEQLMCNVVLRWQRVTAAAAAADECSRRLQHLQARRALRILTNSLNRWRCSVLKSSRAQKDEKLAQVQQDLLLLRAQKQQQQQDVLGMAELQLQLAGLQQQLDAALACKSGLEQIIQQQTQELQQQSDSHKQQLEQMRTEHQAAATVMHEQLHEASSTADEAAQQLQQFQLQQVNQQLQQQLQEKELEYRLQQHQQRQHELEKREKELVQQLSASRSQTKELAGQLKRCSEKLNQQTQAVHTLKCSLDVAQEQIAVASSATRDQNLNLTHQAFTAEKERLRSQQLLHSEQATVLKLQQQVQALKQQVQEQRATADSSATQHQLELGRMAEQLALKDQTIEQLQRGIASVQDRLVDQQSKVFSEVAQLRNGWSQAKAIMKQQRRTIKHQELQLQLAITGVAQPLMSQLGAMTVQQQQRLDGIRLAQTGAVVGTDGIMWGSSGGGSSSQYPITSFVLQSQQQQQLPATGVAPTTGAMTAGAAAAANGAAVAAACVPGSLAWAVLHGQILAGHDVDEGRLDGRINRRSRLAASMQQQLDHLQEQKQQRLDHLKEQEQEEQQQQQDGADYVSTSMLAGTHSSKRTAAKAGCKFASGAERCSTPAAAQGAVRAAELLGCTDEVLRHMNGD